MHAIPREEYMRLAWADPAKGERDLMALPETELAAIARGREAFALFGWKPYMHNPRLKRWLHRIDVPTLLLWGERDGIVSTSYGEAWRAEIPGARMEVIPNAGHFPHWEQPQGFRRAARAFRRQQLRSAPCAAGISPRWPITRRGRRACARHAARRAAVEQLRSADRTWPAEPLPRRVRAVRRGWARHHGERAPQHGDLHDRVGADGTGDHCT